MAMSLFEKAKLVTKSKLHALLDKQVNTVDGYRQLIRDLESAMADVRAGVDEAVGTGNGYKRQLATFNSQIAQKNADIDLLLGDSDPSNDEAAVQLQLEVEGLQDQVTQYQQLDSDQDQQVAQLRQALTQLENKHQQMLTDLNKLTQTQAIASAKNRASAAVEAAAEATSNAGSVDSIQANLDHQRDVADARFARVIGDMQSSQSPEEAARLARAKAALEERRAALAAKAAPATASA